MDQFPFGAVIANAVMAVTPSNTEVLPKTTVMIKAAGAGNVSLELWGGGTTSRTLGAGDEVPNLQIRRVRATGTTATGIEAYYVVKTRAGQ